MTDRRKPYIPPAMKKYSSIFDLPERLREGVADMIECAAALAVVVDDERRYQAVSPRFASLLGYDPEELHGRRIDDVTARGTIDIEFAFSAFLKLGEMDGLWVFERRDGKKVLFHYRARRMDDHLSYAELQPLPLAG
jgi:PAS domain S-box-containing protein